MSAFRPISPALRQALSVSIPQSDESEQLNPLINWIFSVNNNARSFTSENIANLHRLFETFPVSTFKSLSPNKYGDLVTKVNDVYQSVSNLVNYSFSDSELLSKVEIVICTLREKFPQAVRMETPTRRVLNFCFSPIVSSISPVKLEILPEERDKWF